MNKAAIHCDSGNRLETIEGEARDTRATAHKGISTATAAINKVDLLEKDVQQNHRDNILISKNMCKMTDGLAEVVIAVAELKTEFKTSMKSIEKAIEDMKEESKDKAPKLWVKVSVGAAIVAIGTIFWMTLDNTIFRTAMEKSYNLELTK